MSLKSDDKCIKKALPEELLFVLMGRDETAPEIVLEWIKRNIDRQPAKKLHEALDCAINMSSHQNYIAMRVDMTSERKMKHPRRQYPR